MEDNYNYYTSTFHSTPLRTYYVALNRLGGPRKTHLPANKPLGKLSTYVKSFTLTVPEHRSEAIIARLFGTNHVKHGMKHLCDSGKELMPLTTSNLIIPKNCTHIISIVKMKPKSGQQKTQNGMPPAALTDRQHKRHHNGKHPNCTHESCSNKKKAARSDGDNSDKSNNAGGATDSQEATKNKQKQKKNQKKNQNNNKNTRNNKNGIKNVSDGTTSTTTTTTVRTTSTKNQVDLNSIMAATSDDDTRQILDDVSGQSAFADDDDYNYDS